MSKTLKFIKKELLEILPPTIYFFVIFRIVLFTRGLMAIQYGIEFSSTALALIGALVVGKSILIADALPITKMFNQQRLIYNILWKTFLYLSIAVLFQFAEKLIPILIKNGSEGVWHRFSEAMEWPQFFSTNILLLLFLLIYNLASGIIKAIGSSTVKAMVFGLKKDQ